MPLFFLISYFILVIGFVESLTILPKFGASIYLDDVGFFEDYSHLQSYLLFGNRGLWCLGGSQANGLYWSLPDGTQLKERNDSYSEYGITTIYFGTSQTGLALGLFVANSSLLTEGVFQCIVLDLPREGSFTTINLWITKDKHPPQNQASICQLEALLIFANTTAVLVHSQITWGPPTTIHCSLPNTRRENLQTIGYSRSVENRQGVTETAVTIGLFIPITSYPSKVVCTYENSVGLTSFTCLLRESELSSPVITSVTKDSPSSVTIKWENIPELNILAHYRVYKRNPEGLITKAITLQPQLTFFDVFFDLIAYENVFVVAYSSVVSNDTVILPAISREDEVFVQCHPVENYQLEVRVIPYKKDKLLLSTISIVESAVTDFVLREALISDYCELDVRGIFAQEKTQPERQSLVSIENSNGTLIVETSDPLVEPEKKTKKKKTKSKSKKEKTKKTKATKKSKKKENTKSKLTKKSSKTKKGSTKTKKGDKNKPKHKTSNSVADTYKRELNYIDFRLMISCTPCRLFTQGRSSRRVRSSTYRTQTRRRKSSKRRQIKNNIENNSPHEQLVTKRSPKTKTKTHTHRRSHSKRTRNTKNGNLVLNSNTTRLTIGEEDLIAVITGRSNSEFYCGKQLVTSTDTCGTLDKNLWTHEIHASFLLHRLS